jgi:hypothetical protein
VRKLYFSLLFAASLFARINPFEPLDNPNDRNDSRAFLPERLKEELINLPAGAKTLKEIKITHQESDGSISSTDRKIEKSIDWRSPLRVDQPSAAPSPRQTGVFTPIESFEGVDRIAFFVADDVMKLQTKDELIRHFLLPRPSRVTLDFNSSIPLKPQTIKLDDGYFSQIELSFHETFYRAIVTLNGYYPYTIERVSEGYLLGLN